MRLLIGAGLVIGSMGGVWAVVSSADRSVAVYALTSTVAAGDRIDAEDLTVVHVRLGDADGRYVSAGGLDDDAVAVRSLFEGELVPVDAVGGPGDVSSAPVVVTVSGRLPEGVAAGREVDVWSSGQADDGAVAPPAVLVPGAVVSRIVEEDGLVSGATDVSVELAVPDGAVAAVLAAIAAGDTVALVPVVAGVG